MEKIINIKSIKPMFTQVVTTMDKYEEDISDNGILDIRRKKGDVKEFQKVVAVGDSVRTVKVGDLVKINPTRYGRTKHREGTLKDGIISDNPIVAFYFNTVEMDHKLYLLLQDNDIDYIVSDYTMEEQNKKTFKANTPKILV